LSLSCTSIVAREKARTFLSHPSVMTAGAPRRSRRSRNPALSWDSAPAVEPAADHCWAKGQSCDTLDVAMTSLRRAIESLPDEDQHSVLRLIPTVVKAQGGGAAADQDKAKVWAESDSTEDLCSPVSHRSTESDLLSAASSVCAGAAHGDVEELCEATAEAREGGESAAEATAEARECGESVAEGMSEATADVAEGGESAAEDSCDVAASGATSDVAADEVAASGATSDVAADEGTAACPPSVEADSESKPAVNASEAAPVASAAPKKAGAWRPRRRGVEEDRPTILQRQVQGLLNKIAPDNLATIAQQMAEIRIDNAAEMQLVIDIICRKAVREPHYVATYADMAAALGRCYPEFPGDEADPRPKSFTRMVVTTVQAEYQNLPDTLQPTQRLLEECGNDAEEVSFRLSAQKKQVMANMKLIGHLYLRRLISVRIIQLVAQELLFCESKAKGSCPEEHFLECMCELLTAVGYTLEQGEKGRAFMRNCVGRLQELQSKSKVYCKRVQLLVQDLIDLRTAQWKRKMFQASASTKAQIHKAARQADQEDFVFEIAGVRSGVADKIKLAPRSQAAAC